MYAALEKIFFTGGPPASTEEGTYQVALVILSYLVASFASYIALFMAQQLVTSRKTWEKRVFHWGGAFAMGAGIWSMHFIGMLSYKMRMAVAYDPWLTGLSMVIAIVVAHAALAIISRGERLTAGRLATGAVLLGLGICGMHYTGMAAMEMDADLRYRPGGGRAVGPCVGHGGGGGLVDRLHAGAERQPVQGAVPDGRGAGHGRGGLRDALHGDGGGRLPALCRLPL